MVENCLKDDNVDVLVPVRDEAPKFMLPLRSDACSSGILVRDAVGKRILDAVRLRTPRLIVDIVGLWDSMRTGVDVSIGKIVISLGLL